VYHSQPCNNGHDDYDDDKFFLVSKQMQMLFCAITHVSKYFKVQTKKRKMEFNSIHAEGEVLALINHQVKAKPVIQNIQITLLQRMILEFILANKHDVLL